MAGKRKDVFPQFMSFSVLTSAADTGTSARVQLPVARDPAAKRITVVEVLAVSVDWTNKPTGANDSIFASLHFRDPGTTQEEYSNPNLWFQQELSIVLTTSGSSTQIFPLHTRYDTGGGKGFLVATDSIFAFVNSASIGAATAAHFKVLYRFVSIGLQEYIGIVQQQSAQT